MSENSEDYTDHFAPFPAVASRESVEKHLTLARHQRRVYQAIKEHRQQGCPQYLCVACRIFNNTKEN